MKKLLFIIVLCLGLAVPAGAYDVMNIDLNGSTSDPCYSGNGPVSQNYGGAVIIDEWNGYYNVEGDMMESPRCDSIGVPATPGTYARSVFIADDPLNAHGYVPYTTGGELLGDGFLKTGVTDPCIYLYGNWAYGGIFDVYIMSDTAGTFTIRDGNGTIHGPNSLTGGGTESSWIEGQNYVKFTDVWIGGTDTRDANGPIADYLDNDEYVTDPNCAVIQYSNKISGIQLQSVKLRVRASGPADPCVCYWDNYSSQRLQITQGQWKDVTPLVAVNSVVASGRRLFFAADYDAAYETNERISEHDLDGPDAGWALVPGGSPEPLDGYVDEDWAKDGYVSFVDNGEWMEYDVYATSETKGRYRIRALVNCWWAAAEIGIYIDNSSELGTLEHERYEDAVPPITDPNAVVWTENYVNFNLFSGLHKLRWKQNANYYNILGFEISYDGFPPMPCSDVWKYGLGIPGDINRDCYVNFRDLKVLTDYWLRTDCAVQNNCDNADFEPDGDVDFEDYATFAPDWWRCNEPSDPNCEKPWLD